MLGEEDFGADDGAEEWYIGGMKTDNHRREHYSGKELRI